MFVHEGDYEQLITELHKHGSVVGFETRLKKYDGKVIDISLNGSIQTRQGAEVIECFIQNISERKQAERSLKQALNYIDNIINSMPSVLISVDPQLRVTQWNREAEQVTGVSALDALERPLIKVFPRLEKDVAAIRKAMESRQEQVKRKRSYQFEGHVRYENLTIYPLISDGVEGAVIRLDDVTENIRLEEIIVQSEKMLSVGGLAAGMAHEINNPLAGMMQTANVMANRLSSTQMPANLSAAQKYGLSLTALQQFLQERGILRMLAAIHESGQRIAELVDNMLSFSRKSAQGCSTYQLTELLDKTLELATTDYDLKKHYDFKSINIVCHYSDAVPPVPCEASKIQQVFFNILRNAAHAMQDAKVGEPSLILRVYQQSRANFVCVEIEDNGPGMSEAIRKRVFDPFFTTKAEGVGTGLGLSIAYFIISENHGGELSVKSEPGNGCRFIIRLPLMPRGLNESTS